MRLDNKLAIVAAILAIFAFGAEGERAPASGAEWAEWTYYDSSGNAVGGVRIECSGLEESWGVLEGKSTYRLGRCE